MGSIISKEKNNNNIIETKLILLSVPCPTTTSDINTYFLQLYIGSLLLMFYVVNIKLYDVARSTFIPQCLSRKKLYIFHELSVTYYPKKRNTNFQFSSQIYFSKKYLKGPYKISNHKNMCQYVLNIWWHKIKNKCMNKKIKIKTKKNWPLMD